MSPLIAALILFAVVVNGLVLFVAARRFTERNIREGNIRFDYEALQRDLDEEFAPVTRRTSKR